MFGFVIVVVVLAIALFLRYYRSVHFFCPSETAAFLAADADGYVAAMSAADLRARKAPSRAAYMERIVASADSFSVEQRAVLRALCRRVDAFYTAYRTRWLDGRQVARLPWRIALTRGDAYECGLPHTRKDTVFLSTEQFRDATALFGTLVHEKLHLYQRAHPPDLSALGYARVGRRADVALVRANPDVDEYVYKDPRSGKVMVNAYRSREPADILDVHGTREDEHPYESLAYAVERAALT